MSVTLFAGAFFGALLGFSTRNKTSAICRYVFGKHPVMAKINWNDFAVRNDAGSVAIPGWDHHHQ